MPNHWLFTCNPDRWNVWGYFEAGHSLTELNGWSMGSLVRSPQATMQSFG